MKQIALSQGKFAIVDDDFPVTRKWYANKEGKTFYAKREHHGKTIKLHNVVFEFFNGPIPDGMTIDHKDRQPLNCQLSNLRLATRSEQNQNQGKRITNTSGFIGVSWYKPHKKWKAQTSVKGKYKYLGYYDDPFSAAFVRDAYVKQHHGEFASLNNLTDRRKGERRAA